MTNETMKDGAAVPTVFYNDAARKAEIERSGCYPSCTTAEYCDCRPVPWLHKG